MYTSNVEAGARIAASLGRDVAIFDGSGAALPPIATDRRIAVVGGHQEPHVVAGYLNTYRLLLADLVLVTMAEAGSGLGSGSRCGARSRATRSRGRSHRAPAHPGPGHPRPLDGLLLDRAAGRAREPRGPSDRASTARTSSTYPGISATAPRSARSLPSVEADVFLVELKAAAIDVVAEHALARGADVVLAANDVFPISSDRGLDETLLEMAGITS